MQENGVSEVVDILDNIKPIGCIWILKSRDILNIILSITRQELRRKVLPKERS